MKPQGYLAVSTLKSTRMPWGDRLLEIQKSYQDKLTPVPAMKTKDLNEEKDVTEELEAVGFVDIEHQIDSRKFYFRNETEWWQA